MSKTINKTELERRAKNYDFAAPVTSTASIAETIVVGFGDGSVRLFQAGHEPKLIKAHEGVVLCMAVNQSYIFTGGDDGKFLRISLSGDVEEIANFGSRWVDCVAATSEAYACSSDRATHVWSRKGSKASVLEHNSTVGGLAFDSKGKRLAVAHYGGVTVWEPNERRWKSKKLIWKGFHSSVTFSPDDKYIITIMQENALHGWRIRDKADLAMAGYPTKIKSFDWVGETPYLATSGADAAICWPFDRKDGPLGRAPVCVADGEKQLSTYVCSLSEENAVFAGFKNGEVLLAEIDESKDSIVLKNATNREITAISLTKSLSHILIGDEGGHVLWAALWAGALNDQFV